MNLYSRKISARFFSRLWPVLCLAAAALPARAALKKAEVQARRAVDEVKRERVKGHRELDRLRKDLRYISEELDREILVRGKTLRAYSEGGLRRLEGLRGRGDIHDKLGPALELLEEIYEALPEREYAEQYAGGLVKAIAHELRWIAQEAKNQTELLETLKAHLILPEQAPGEEDAFSSLALFPVDLPVDKFERLGPIRIFLVKHRIKRPRSHARTSAEAIAAGRHNVQVGVLVEGEVVRQDRAVDQDYTFDIGTLHIELTPEWRILHPGIHRPTVGERICVKGWTYFDIFHKNEWEYDPEDPVLGVNRVHVWEIHPVQEIQLRAPGVPCTLR